jgi:hypothetical protein
MGRRRKDCFSPCRRLSRALAAAFSAQTATVERSVTGRGKYLLAHPVGVGVEVAKLSAAFAARQLVKFRSRPTTRRSYLRVAYRQ